jgi:hypothetical protein
MNDHATYSDYYNSQSHRAACEHDMMEEEAAYHVMIETSARSDNPADHRIDIKHSRDWMGWQWLGTFDSAASAEEYAKEYDEARWADYHARYGETA